MRNLPLDKILQFQSINKVVILELVFQSVNVILDSKTVYRVTIYSQPISQRNTESRVA